MRKPRFERLVSLRTALDFIRYLIEIFLVDIAVLGVIRDIIIVLDSPPDKIDCRIWTERIQNPRVMPKFLDALRDPRLFIIHFHPLVKRHLRLTQTVTPDITVRFVHDCQKIGAFRTTLRDPYVGQKILCDPVLIEIRNLISRCKCQIRRHHLLHQKPRLQVRPEKHRNL